MYINILAKKTAHVWNTLMSIEKALVEKNATVLGHMLAADFVGSTPTGESFSKDEYIIHHCTPGFGIVALDGGMIDDANIRFYNNTAVVNRITNVQFKLPAGIVLEYKVRRIEIFVKENTQWLLVSGQGTQVKQMSLPAEEQQWIYSIKNRQ